MNNNIQEHSSWKSNSLKSAPAALVSHSHKEKYKLLEDVNIIGRNENALICIRDPLISRIHCFIYRTEDNQFTICDKSSTGTFVKGKRLVKDEIQKLHHKDTISLSAPDKHVFIFFLNKSLDLSVDQKELLNSQMREKLLSLDSSHSMELNKLNQELYKIESEKSGLKEEMNLRLKDQENSFKAERLSMSNLVTLTEEQKDKAEKKLKKMEQKFTAEKKELMEEIENKIANMNKKEEELQELKLEMELQHQKDKKELEEKFQAEVLDLKLKLEMSEMEQDRLQEETREAKQQLAESKQILLECEIEQSRLADEKVEVETKLASTIIDLTNEKDNLLRDLQMKLKEKETEQERVKKEMEGLEEHLMCSICTEIFIEPTVLNCGHMFCKTCINQWKSKKKILCPMCRTKISGCIQVFNLDSIIEKNVALLSSEAKDHRDSEIEKRKKSHLKPEKNKKHKAARTTPYNGRHQSNNNPNHDYPSTPMVLIPNMNPHLAPFEDRVTRRTAVNQEEIMDPFAWHAASDRRIASNRPFVPLAYPYFPPLAAPLEAGDPMSAIDLTNVFETPVQRTPNATAPSTSTSGFVDLTVTP